MGVTHGMAWHRIALQQLSVQGAATRANLWRLNEACKTAARAGECDFLLCTYYLSTYLSGTATMSI